MKSIRLMAWTLVFGATFLSGPSRAQTAGYNPNYLLLGADSIDSPDDAEQTECDVKFQLSFSTLLSTESSRKMNSVDKFISFTGPLYFGYTQRSYWDICRESAPFRATDYRPEIFFKNSFKAMSINAESFTGFVHESNGTDGEGSRSWDRIYARLRFPFGRSRNLIVSSTDTTEWVVDAQVWVPFSLDSNNLDLQNYAGYGELSATYTPNAKNRFRLSLRKGGGFTDWDRGLGTLDWIFGLPSTNVELMAQYTNGYGDSLDRYDQHEYSLRIGFIFSDFNPPEVECRNCETDDTLQLE